MIIENFGSETLLLSFGKERLRLDMLIFLITRLGVYTTYTEQRWTAFFTEQDSNTTDFTGKEANLGHYVGTY